MVRITKAKISKAAISVSILSVLAFSLLAAAPGNDDSHQADGTEQQSFASSIDDIAGISPQDKYLAMAVKIAADQSVGYSFDNCNLNPNVICYTFISRILLDSNADGISDAEQFATALKIEDPETEPRLVGMGGQMRALESVGFVRHEFSGFDDPDLVPGSVLYACGKGGNAKHVEFFLGKYDLENLDDLGNPEYSEEGAPLTIGARITDNDPTDGDQQQASPGTWLTGEVGAFEGYSRGEDYWTCYYAPENLEIA